MQINNVGGAVATDETDRLISSDKAVGTAVYNRQGEHLGSVYNLMIDKYSGQVAYAVISFGGFLGMGESYHPLPWRTLTYDTRKGVMLSMSTARGSRKPQATRRALCPTGPTEPTGTASTTSMGYRRTAFEQKVLQSMRLLFLALRLSPNC
jgi:hypothetical protein